LILPLAQRLLSTSVTNVKIESAGDGAWIERRIAADGSSGCVVSPHSLRLQPNDMNAFDVYIVSSKAGASERLIASEHDIFVLSFLNADGTMKTVETTTMLAQDSRIRSAQHFDNSGNLLGTYVAQEKNLSTQ